MKILHLSDHAAPSQHVFVIPLVGIVALWLRDMPISISAAVGLIAMSGVAVLDDMILISYFRQLRQTGLPRDEAVRTAAVR